MNTEDQTTVEGPNKKEKKGHKREDALEGVSRSEFDRIQDNIKLAKELIAVSEGKGDEVGLGHQKLLLESYQSELELFWAEHDNAGAFKMKKFDRKLLDQLAGDPEKGIEATIKKNKDGSFELADSAKNRRMLIVDMLELDRLNKEGSSHDAGDVGLGITVDILKQEALNVLGAEKGAAKFEVFRTGGNQYMLNFDEISEADLENVAQAVARRNADISSKVGKKVEAAPLAVTSVNMADVIEDLNEIQASTYDIPVNDEASREVAGREIMAVLLRAGNWGAEVAKFKVRAGRVLEKLERGDADTKDFYDAYVSKMMKGTPLDGLEAFKRAKAGDNLDGVIGESSLAAARARFGLDRSFDAKADANLVAGIRSEIVRVRKQERIKAKGSVPRTIYPPDHWAAKLSDELDVLEHGKIAGPPEETKGHQELRDAKDAADKAKKALERAMASGESPEIITELTLKADIARNKSNTEIARRNADTGLLERGVYYEDLQKALKAGTEVSSIFIDMGFLKYFDQKGGTEVGNNAVKSAASLIEQAIAKAGLDGQAYRYGGDEFAVLYNGPKADAAKFVAALDELKKAFGRIPATDKSNDEYIPTELQFNSGASDTTEMTAAFEKASKGQDWAGLEEDDVLNKKAELLTKTADTRVETTKALSRFGLLISELSRPEFKDKRLGGASEGETDLLSRQIEAKVEFSRKALFSEFGGETALRVFADELRRTTDPKERAALIGDIEAQVSRFVADRIEYSHKSEEEKKALLDRFLEARTRVHEFNARIKVLEAEKAALIKQAGQEHEKVASLEKKLAQMRADFETIKNVRGSLAA